jgi:hypothetical protein
MEKSRHAARVELLQLCVIALLQTVGWAQRYGVQGSLRVLVLQSGSMRQTAGMD